MFLKILAHPVFPLLNFHMPMIVDLSHPLIMLQGENGSGKSTLLHSIYFALRGEKTEGYIYRLEPDGVKIGESYLFDAEQHNPRQQLELFKNEPQMLEFLRMASHGHQSAVYHEKAFRYRVWSRAAWGPIFLNFLLVLTAIGIAGGVNHSGKPERHATPLGRREE